MGNCNWCGVEGQRLHHILDTNESEGSMRHPSVCFDCIAQEFLFIQVERDDLLKENAELESTLRAMTKFYQDLPRINQLLKKNER